MKRKLGLLALALALGLFVAACGGGGDGGGSAGGGDRLSKDDYIAKVTAVGEKMSGTLEGLGETPSDPEGRREAVRGAQRRAEGCCRRASGAQPARGR